MKKNVKIALGILGGALGLRWLLDRGSARAPYAAVRYVPGSPEQIALFEDAARAGGLPTSWASDPAFVTLLKKESGGWVGIPNYTYGAIRKERSKWPLIWDQLKAGIITAKSSATGLGQLTLSNTDAHYPAGRLGIGDAHNEAVGMLSYIKKRYGSPDAALQFHLQNGWY